MNANVHSFQFPYVLNGAYETTSSITHGCCLSACFAIKHSSSFRAALGGIVEEVELFGGIPPPWLGIPVASV